MPIMMQNSKTKLMCGGSKIKKMYCQGDVIYSSGNVVTYYVGEDTVYQEEVDEGESCLEPKSFMPEREDYTFAGWSAEPGGAAVDGMIMGDEPITLYAVWTYAGTPFYIVQNTVCKQILTWTLTEEYNISRLVPIRWNIGNSYPSVSSDYNNYNLQSWFRASSNNFSTQGNKSIRISWNGSSGGQRLWINGVEKTSGSIWNISGLDTIRIDVEATRVGQTAGAFIQFSEIYLF